MRNLVLLALGLLATAVTVAGCGGGEPTGGTPLRSDALSVGTLTPGRSATDAPATPPAEASGGGAAGTVPPRTPGRTDAGGAPGPSRDAS